MSVVKFARVKDVHVDEMQVGIQTPQNEYTVEALTATLFITSGIRDEYNEESGESFQIH